MDKYSTHDIVKNASAVLAQLQKNAAYKAPSPQIAKMIADAAQAATARATAAAKARIAALKKAPASLPAPKPYQDVMDIYHKKTPYGIDPADMPTPLPPGHPWLPVRESTHDIVKNASVVLAQLRKNAADPRMYSVDPAPTPQPMTGVAGAMKRVGDTSAKMPIAGVGVVPKMVGQNIGAMAPAVQAAGNKLVAAEKNFGRQATGGVPMFGIMPTLAGLHGRFLGGK